jgi:hypothetical protein
MHPRMVYIQLFSLCAMRHLIHAMPVPYNLVRACHMFIIRIVVGARPYTPYEESIPAIRDAPETCFRVVHDACIMIPCKHTFVQ